MLRIVVALLALAGPVADAEVTILTADRIHTMNPARPTATAMAWDARAACWRWATRSRCARRFRRRVAFDATGMTVVPGLIDAHGHIMSLGLALMRADLVGAATKDEAIARLREFARTLPRGRVAPRPGLGPERLARKDRTRPPPTSTPRFRSARSGSSASTVTPAGPTARRCAPCIATSAASGNPTADESCAPTAVPRASSSTPRSRSSTPSCRRRTPRRAPKP